MAEKDSTDDDIADCNPASGEFPWIELTFQHPQTTLEVDFFDIEETGNTRLRYWVAGSAPKTVTVTSGGDSQPSPLDLSGLTDPAPVDMEKIRLLSGIVIASFSAALGKHLVESSPMFCLRIRFGGSGAFTSMKICKGAGSLVGDPHVRTLDKSHYTVLSQGNFLAWSFKAPTEYKVKSADKKAEAGDGSSLPTCVAGGVANLLTLLVASAVLDRGLLLVDKSMGKDRQSLEITAQDCKLRRRWPASGRPWSIPPTCICRRVATMSVGST